MTQIRAVTDEEIHLAIQLADTVFRTAEQKSMGAGFPDLFSKSHASQSYAVFEEGNVVAFTGLAPNVVQIGPAKIPIYSLGAVCTHPDHRGNGYATQLLEKVMHHVDEAGASLLLVSGNRCLYERAHCYPFGGLYRYRLTRAQLDEVGSSAEDRSQQVSIRSVRPTDWFSMKQLSDQRAVHYEQSIHDLIELTYAQAYPSCLKMGQREYVAVRDSGISAYVMVAVPGQTSKIRHPFVIDWAGDAADVTMILRQVLHRHEHAQVEFSVAWHEQTMLDLLSPAGALPRLTPNSGTVRVINGQRLLEQLRPYLLTQNDSLADCVQITQENDEPGTDGCIRLRVDNEDVTLTVYEFVSLLFQPNPDIPVSAEMKQRLTHLFPIPFPNTYGLHYT